MQSILGILGQNMVKKKINTTLTVSILKPIEPGLGKEIFTKELENTIYTELDTLS